MIISNTLGVTPGGVVPLYFFEKKNCQSSLTWAFKPSPYGSNRLLKGTTPPGWSHPGDTEELILSILQKTRTEL